MSGVSTKTFNRSGVVAIHSSIDSQHRRGNQGHADGGYQRVSGKLALRHNATKNERTETTCIPAGRHRMGGRRPGVLSRDRRSNTSLNQCYVQRSAVVTAAAKMMRKTINPAVRALSISWSHWPTRSAPASSERHRKSLATECGAVLENQYPITKAQSNRHTSGHFKTHWE